jgi:hypothetical protein
MTRRLTAEFIDTLWLVLGGCGSAVLGGAAGAGILYVIASGHSGFDVAGWVGGDEPAPIPVTGQK